MKKHPMVSLFMAVGFTSGMAQAQETTPTATAANTSLNIVVNRDAGKMGSLCVTQLYVDGSLVAQVAPGQSTSFAAPAGAKELMARPALDSYICKKIYSLPEWEIRVPLNAAAGPQVTYRYGFTAKGVPFLESASQ